MNIQDLPDESDTSDEDYDPGLKEDVVSEVESDGDPEEPLSDNEETTFKSKKRRKGKRKAKKSSKAKLNERGKFFHSIQCLLKIINRLGMGQTICEFV